MNAQAYFDANCGGDNRCQNNVVDTIHNPTYVRALHSDRTDGHIDIAYWWFYGYQGACSPFAIGGAGAHDRDWEHVIVHIANSEIESVTYFQHDGYYTTTDFEKMEQHPIVYVGKVSHGSYKNPTPLHIGGGCGDYWE